MAAHVDLLRHGDTGQRGFRGHLDDPLSADGWGQMRRAAAKGQWDVVVTSPLQRCAAFARELAALGHLPLRVDDRWREYHFGQWQDVPIQLLAREQGDALARFWADPAAHPPPGGESFADFSSRVQAAAGALTHDPGRVLVVTHGGPIRWLRCLAAGEGPGRMSGVEVAHASLHALATAVCERLARNGRDHGDTSGSDAPSRDPAPTPRSPS